MLKKVKSVSLHIISRSNKKTPITESLFSNLNEKTMSHERFQQCIDACLECAVECEHCATACLSEQDVKMMARCIMLDRECAAICFTSAKIMGMGGEHASEVCRVCADICDACGEECAKHEADHCQQCAKVCRNCAEECRKMVEEYA